MERLYSRRSVVMRGSALLAAIAGIGATAVPGWAKKKPKARSVWRLDAQAGRCPPRAHGPDCSGCHACRKHAKNKRFPTAKAANKHRAHPHCKCKVRKAGKISRSSWVKLFGEPGNLKRKSIDLRDPKRFQQFQAGRAAVGK